MMEKLVCQHPNGLKLRSNWLKKDSLVHCLFKCFRIEVFMRITPQEMGSLIWGKTFNYLDTRRILVCFHIHDALMIHTNSLSMHNILVPIYFSVNIAIGFTEVSRLFTYTDDVFLYIASWRSQTFIQVHSSTYMQMQTHTCARYISIKPPRLHTHRWCVLKTPFGVVTAVFPLRLSSGLFLNNS